MDRKTKPQPVVADGEVAEECWKCGGTGFWCRGTLNGQPYSQTGFDCWTCSGSGWKVKSTSKRSRTKVDAEPMVITRNAETGEVVQADNPNAREGRSLIAGRKSELKYDAGWVLDGDVYRNPDRQYTISASIDRVSVEADRTRKPRGRRHR